MRATKKDYFLLLVNIGLALTLSIFIFLYISGDNHLPFIKDRGLHGFVSINTKPEKAKVIFNNKAKRGLTPINLSFVKPGTYSVEINKNNYFDWQKKVDVVAGKITDLSYILLIPINIQKKVFLNQDIDLKQTGFYLKDNKQLSFLDSKIKSFEGTNQQVLISPEIINSALSDEDKLDNQEQIINIKNPQFNQDYTKLIIEASSENNNACLLIENLDSNISIQNLSKKYAINCQSLFWNKNRLYSLDESKLKQINYSQKTISGTIKDGLIGKNIIDDKLYIFTKNNTTADLYTVNDNTLDLVLDNLPLSDNYQLKIAEVTLNNSTTNTLRYVVKNGENNLTAYQIIDGKALATTLSKTANRVLFDDSNQFSKIIYWVDNGLLYSFNMETQEQFSTEYIEGSTYFEYKKHHLLQLNNNLLSIQDFDFKNRHELTNSNSVIVYKNRIIFNQDKVLLELILD